MRTLLKFLRLPWRDQGLLAAATLSIVLCRFALRVLPFKITMRVMDAATTARAGAANPPDIARVAWAMRVASRRAPGARCLPCALAARLLLGWNGQPSQIRIGVLKTPDGQLQAHAWVESRGEVVVGGSRRLDRFALLPDVQSPPPFRG